MSSDVLVETPFERRLIAIKEKFGESLVRTPTYTFCETIEATDEVMATRYLREIIVQGGVYKLRWQDFGLFRPPKGQIKP